MKNTQENKERFFALYWGQKIITSPGISRNLTVSGGHLLRPIKDDYLSLKSLSDIENVHAAELAKIFGIEEDGVFVGKWMAVGQFDTSADSHEVYLYNSNAAAVDYLRSKSYLLPFGDITVEEILEFGWAKV